MSDKPKTYIIFGDYGFTSQTLLYDTTDLLIARRWAQLYTEAENAGGHDIIEVAWFAPDGTYETEWVWRRDDEEEAA